jgi:hypothetical protein
MTYRSLLAASLLLAACTAASPADTTTPVSKDGVLDLTVFHLMIQDAGAPLHAQQSGPDSYDVTGSGTQTMYIQHVPYGQPSDGLGDYLIPTVIGKQLQTDQACFILGQAGTGVYLPVKTERLMQCGVFVNGDGQKIIAAVGYAQTFESPDHLGSMLIVPRKDDAIVFSDIVAFPAYQQWLRTKSDIFYGEHTNDNLWPPTSPAAEKFYQDATDEVGRNIGQPSEEVAKNMNELEAWTKRITLY